MDKREYLKKLNKELGSLPKNQRKKCLDFYDELINDYMEESFTEIQAVDKLQPPKDAAATYLADFPQVVVPEQTKKKVSVLTVLGFPLWLTLILCVLAVIVSVYAALFSVYAAYAAVLLSFLLTGAGLALFSPLHLILNSAVAGGFLLLGIGLIFLALSFYILRLAKPFTKLMIGIAVGFGKITRKVFWLSKGAF